MSLIVIPFCLSVCLDVCRSFRDLGLQPTTIDRSQPNLVGRSSDPCKPFGSPISHTVGARGKICKISSDFQYVDSGYSCHCERDASCHMTCIVYLLCPPYCRGYRAMLQSVRLSVCLPRRLSRSLGSGMGVLPLHTHSIGGSTVCQMPRDTAWHVCFAGYMFCLR